MGTMLSLSKHKHNKKPPHNHHLTTTATTATSSSSNNKSSSHLRTDSGSPVVSKRSLVLYSSLEVTIPTPVIDIIDDYAQNHHVILIGGHQWKNGGGEAPHIWFGNPFNDRWLPGTASASSSFFLPMTHIDDLVVGPSLPNYVKSQNPAIMYRNGEVIVTTGQVGSTGYGEREQCATYHLRVHDLWRGYAQQSDMIANLNATYYDRHHKDGTSTWSRWIRRPYPSSWLLNRSGATSIVTPVTNHLHIISGSVQQKQHGRTPGGGRPLWLSSHIMFDGDHWHNLPSYPLGAVSGVALTCSNDGRYIYASGGLTMHVDASGTCTNKVYIYDTINGTWSALPDLVTNRYYACSFVVKDCLYVAGGFDTNGSIMSSIDCFSMITKEWTLMTDFRLPEPLAAMNAIRLENHICIIGGLTNHTPDWTSRCWSIPCYQLTNNTWKRGDLPVNVSYAGCVVVNDDE
jgi:hypothetical protein